MTPTSSVTPDRSSPSNRIAPRPLTRLGVLTPYLMLAVGLAAANATLHSAVPKWSRVHYLGLTLACAGCVLVVQRFAGRWRSRRVLIAVALSVAAITAWYFQDWCEELDEQYDRDAQVYVFYRDTKKRWNGQYLYRRMTVYERPGDTDPSAFLEGPITPDGKRSHGRWRFTHWVPERSSQTRWYWQDEEVSEREWQQRAARK